MFGFDLSYTTLFVVLVGVGFAILIPIPFALGALEGIEVLLLRVIGQSADLGIAFGMITRLRDMMWASVGMVYMYRKGVKIEDEIKTKREKLV
jgi:uncharacterized membrane protein YbhN (UPF0104 family)